MAASNNTGGGEPLVAGPAENVGNVGDQQIVLPKRTQPTASHPEGRPLEIVTIGRMVHFLTPSLQHRSAVVTAVGAGGIEDTVELTVYWSHEDRPAIGNQELIGRRQHVPFDRAGKIPYSWHWPERAAGFNNMQAAPDAGRGNQ